MAVPKRRLSKCRRDRRRANWKLEAPGYVACPQCHEPKMPHRVCPTCCLLYTSPSPRDTR